VEDDEVKWPPPAEEGWVLDKALLFTLITLQGLRVGDEMYFSSTYKLKPVRFKFLSEDHCEHIHRIYANPGVRVKAWELLAWRRPQ
jgi:hypothetical protein